MASPDEHQRDYFAPPQPPIRVGCLHCGAEYNSDQMVWTPRPNIHGEVEDGMTGDWCCPTEGCDGVGFGFDILPTDPTWRDENGGGWHSFDDEDEEEDSFDPDAEEDEEDFTFSNYDAPEQTGPFWKHDPSVLRPADAPDELNVDPDAETERPVDRMFDRDDQDIPF